MQQAARARPGLLGTKAVWCITACRAWFAAGVMRVLPASTACLPAVPAAGWPDHPALPSPPSPRRLSVVRTYCGHGIGDLFHCAPNVPHYAKNKAKGTMKVGEVFTIGALCTHKCVQDQE